MYYSIWLQEQAEREVPNYAMIDYEYYCGILYLPSLI